MLVLLPNWIWRELRGAHLRWNHRGLGTRAGCRPERYLIARLTLDTTCNLPPHSCLQFCYKVHSFLKGFHDEALAAFRELNERAERVHAASELMAALRSSA